MRVPHGTVAGYEKHVRSKRPACEACKKAKARYMIAWKVATGRSDAMDIPVAVLAEVAATGDTAPLIEFLGDVLLDALAKRAARDASLERRTA